MDTLRPLTRLLSRRVPTPHPRDIVLTGTARGGTTLACELLNEVPDVVALDEPLNGPELTAAGRDGAVEYVARAMARSRRSIRTKHRVLTKHVGGAVLGDKLTPAVGGERGRLAEWSEIDVTKPLGDDFALVMKHPAMFTAALGQLMTAFACFAVVRNPIAVICSWETVPWPISEGHQPAAEAMAPELAARLAQIEDVTRRQIELVDWTFEQYRDLLPREHVIRYEDVAAEGMAAFAVIAPQAASVPRRVENRNRSYDAAARRRVGEQVLAHDGAWLAFYDRDEIAELLD